MKKTGKIDRMARSASQNCERLLARVLSVYRGVELRHGFLRAVGDGVSLVFRSMRRGRESLGADSPVQDRMFSKTIRRDYSIRIDSSVRRTQTHLISAAKKKVMPRSEVLIKDELVGIAPGNSVTKRGLSSKFEETVSVERPVVSAPETQALQALGRARVGARVIEARNSMDAKVSGKNAGSGSGSRTDARTAARPYAPARSELRGEVLNQPTRGLVMSTVVLNRKQSSAHPISRRSVMRPVLSEHLLREEKRLIRYANRPIDNPVSQATRATLAPAGELVSTVFAGISEAPRRETSEVQSPVIQSASGPALKFTSRRKAIPESQAQAFATDIPMESDGRLMTESAGRLPGAAEGRHLKERELVGEVWSDLLRKANGQVLEGFTESIRREIEKKLSIEGERRTWLAHQ